MDSLDAKQAHHRPAFRVRRHDTAGMAEPHPQRSDYGTAVVGQSRRAGPRVGVFPLFILGTGLFGPQAL